MRVTYKEYRQWKKSKGNRLYLDTGSTLLNLAICDKAAGGIPTGIMLNIIGDSSSGKTFLALTALACGCYDPNFMEHSKILDDAENADCFNKQYLFGKKAAGEMRNPRNKEGLSESSQLFEDFEVNARNELINPSLYVLDSFDSISDKDEEEHTKKRLQAHEDGKETAGSYGMGKAKKASSFFRQITGTIKKSSSILIIISQTRDNIDPMSRKKRTRAGGKALKFYSSVEMWLTELGKIKETINGIDTTVGIRIQIEVSKNKITGKYKKFELHIYYNYGVDDITSCIDFLVKMKVWRKKTAQAYVVPQWKFEGTRKKLIQYIEKNKKMKEVRAIVQKAWDAFEDKAAGNRVPKFGE